MHIKSFHYYLLVVFHAAIELLSLHVDGVTLFPGSFLEACSPGVESYFP